MIVTLKKGGAGGWHLGHTVHRGIERRVCSAGAPFTQRRVRSGNLGYVGRLGSFLSLHNLKFHLIALLQALVAFGGN